MRSQTRPDRHGEGEGAAGLAGHGRATRPCRAAAAGEGGERWCGGASQRWYGGRCLVRARDGRRWKRRPREGQVYWRRRRRRQKRLPVDDPRTRRRMRRRMVAVDASMASGNGAGSGGCGGCGGGSEGAWQPRQSLASTCRLWCLQSRRARCLGGDDSEVVSGLESLEKRRGRKQEMLGETRFGMKRREAESECPAGGFILDN